LHLKDVYYSPSRDIIKSFAVLKSRNSQYKSIRHSLMEVDYPFIRALESGNSLWIVGIEDWN